MKIEVFPAELNAKISTQVPNRDKLESLMVDVLECCKTAVLCENDGILCAKSKTLVMACQMLWNELERKNEEITELKKKNGLVKEE